MCMGERSSVIARSAHTHNYHIGALVILIVGLSILIWHDPHYILSVLMSEVTMDI